MRETVRAFWPSSVDSRLKRSISSITSMGMRTLLSLKAEQGVGVVEEDIGVKNVVFHCGDGVF